MTITATQIPALENPFLATGTYSDAAGSPAAMVVDVGFFPRYICMVNQTTRVMHEWFHGMTNGHAIRTVAAGTRTAETSGGISINAVTGEITFPAVAQNDVVRWQAVK